MISNRLRFAVPVIVPMAMTLGLAMSCAQRPPARSHVVHESVAVEHRGALSEATSPVEFAPQSNAFDFQQRSPVEFLGFLAQECVDADGFTSVTVFGTHCGWIQAADVPVLLEHLDSTRRCRPVTKGISSYRSTAWSTIGREAAFLLEGFRAEVEGTGYGGYPPALNSDSWVLPDSAVLHDWWERFSAAR